MRLPSFRLLLAFPVMAAIVLGMALIWLAEVTAQTLSERDKAVRDGVLLRLGHDLETELREVGPADAQGAVKGFLAAHTDALVGIEVAGPQEAIITEGTVSPEASQQRVMLGPAWRGVIGPSGGGQGPGRGPQVTLRLHPTLTLGTSRRLAPVVLIGALIAAAALVGFSILGVAGLAFRQKLAIAQGEQQRLEVLARAGAGLAHRVRNPLAGIKGTAQLLVETTSPPTDARAKRILEASNRIETLLGRLLEYARPQTPQARIFDLVGLTQTVANRSMMHVRLTSDGSVSAWADTEHVESILEELLANAHVFDPDGEVEIIVKRVKKTACVEVNDRGPGLDSDSEKVFEPYVTTRPEGTGLGLPIVRALARANFGDVTLTNRVDGGCTARLTLPTEST